MAKARVRYKGFSDVREFKVKQLREHGVGVDQDLVFSRDNNFTILIDLNDDLEEILRKEGTFTISEITDEGDVGDEIVKATIADDTAVAATTVDADTGQTEENKQTAKKSAAKKAAGK